MAKLQQFFWWSAGVDRSIIQECPSENSKYVGIGASVFFTGVFAALAAGYAINTVFDSWIYSLLFGLLWGTLIFNLDRFIVSSLRKTGRPGYELLLALPRIILAIIISIVIAKPLELKVFEKEINSEITLMEEEDISSKEKVIAARFFDENQQLKSEIDDLQQAILIKERQRDTLMQIAQKEADGTGGTMRRNAGPIYKIKKTDADRAEIELNELRKRNNRLISEKRKEIGANDSLKNTAVSAMEASMLNGLASRLEAMDRITNKSEAIFVAHWFILLLFIAIETAPIFVKLIAPRGPYDHLLNAKEYGYEAGYYHDIAKTNHNVKKKSTRLSIPEKEFLDEMLKLKLDKS